MTIRPYLFFNGRCVEGLDGYKKTLKAWGGGGGGGGARRSHDAEGYQQDSPRLLLHRRCCLVMCSDGMQHDKPNFRGFSLSHRRRRGRRRIKPSTHWPRKVEMQMPIGKTFLTPARFGCVANFFGVSWMVIVEPK